MTDIRKSALALLASFALLTAACSSSSATLPAGGNGGGGAGASNGGGGAGASAAVNPNSPDGILSQVIAGSPTVKSFHIKIEINGTIKAAALKQMSGSDAALGAITSDIKLDGTAVEGDVDVAGQAAHLTLNVAPIQALGGVPITGDMILKDNALYYKVTLLGPKYTKTDLASLSSLGSGLGVPVPTPGASALTNAAGELASMQQQLKDAGVTMNLVGVDKIGGKDANHIAFTLPIDKLNAQIAAAAATDPTAAGVKIDSASADLWVYKDTNQFAKAELKGASSTLGNLDFVITVTNYDAPVTVTAPKASEINPVTP